MSPRQVEPRESDQAQMTTQSAPTLSRYVTGHLQVGDPDVAGPLAVYPVTGAAPALEYLGFAQAIGSGLAIKELSDGADVNDLVVLNPTPHHVLLYEGEEVRGAQQNRTFDVSVLVPAGAHLSVPVSCVEAGRWDGARAEESFEPAPQAAYPALRRMKNEQARMQVADGAIARADQGEVWREVSEKHARHGAASRTGAMDDVFEHRRHRLADLLDAVSLRPEQCGAVVAIGGRIDLVDHVSRPEVFTSLHTPLLQGYALDALEVADAPAPSVDEIQSWLDGVLTAHVPESDGIGLGRDVRFDVRAASGAGLVSGRELVQLTAFARRRGEIQTAIRRPSRRRH